MAELLPILLLIITILFLLSGYPVAFVLGGISLLIALIADAMGYFDLSLMNALPSRFFRSILINETLIAVPLFILMGNTLEKTRLAENVLLSLSQIMGNRRGGILFAVIFVGTLLAASTGIVGATVVTLTLLAIPSMQKANYDMSLASGTICATGTLGQIIPPSIALILLGDVLSSSYQEAQRQLGNFSPEPVSAGALFTGALIPGLVLVSLYCIYLLIKIYRRPELAPAITLTNDKLSLRQLFINALPTLLLILIVLGSIFAGIATPTEAAALGAVGALLIAKVQGNLSWSIIKEIQLSTAKTTGMIFMILIGSSIFSLVFRGLGGDTLIHDLFIHLPGGKWSALFIIMLIIFLLGFILDFIEITFVVVPIIAPILFIFGFDPIWLGIMLAINLQTSFLTPPFGFALFYYRGIAPNNITTATIYRGIIPFILLQLTMLLLLTLMPDIVTYLPNYLSK